MGGGREAPELAKNWSSGRRTKVSERAPQLGGEAGPGGRPRLGCSRPPSCARDGAGRRSPPLAMQAPLHTDGSHENTRPTEGQGNNTRTGLWPPPPLVTRDSGLRDPQPRAQNGRRRRVAAAPSQPAPSAGEDQSPQSRARRMLPPSSPERAPPSQHPRQALRTGTPGYLAAAGGRRHLRAARPERDSKVCRRKVSPPTWGGGCRGSEGGRWRAALGRCFWPAVRAPSESRRCWLKINWAAGAAARVGPDSCARTANMDAHQVLAAGRCGDRGGSRWELVGRAGSSGRGKERRKGRRRREEEERPGAQPEGRGLPSSSPAGPTAPSARSAAWDTRVLRSGKRRV